MSQFQPTFFQGLVVVTLYLLPSSIAVLRRANHLGTGFLVNLFLGWTVVGWVYALTWAVFSDRRGESLGDLEMLPPVRKEAPVRDRRDLRPAA